MIVIIDYGLGNLGSIANMLRKVRVQALVSSDPAEIERAEKLILPGVGAFDRGMQNLQERGLLPVINQKVLQDRTPILGLCLGMQLFARRSEEGVLPGLGWIEADVRRFRFADAQAALTIPHMGWNTLLLRQPSPLWRDWDEAEVRFYFAHSYHVVCDDERNVLACANYGYEFPAMVIRDNIVGTQFHPEKSHKYGMRLMKNFAEHFGYDATESYSLLAAQEPGAGQDLKI